MLLHPDRGLRHAMRWYTQMGRRVWPHEISDFLRDPLRTDGPTVAEFWGAAAGCRGGVDDDPAGSRHPSA